MASIFPQKEEEKLRFGLVMVIGPYPDGKIKGGQHTIEITKNWGMEDHDEERAIKITENLVREMFRMHRQKLQDLKKGN